MINKKRLQSKFGTNVIWNLISFGLASVIAILLNLIIINVYDEEILGVYNQNYALFMIISQLAVGGIHLSVLSNTKVKNDAKHNNFVIVNALITVLVVSSSILTLAYIFNWVPGYVLNSDGVTSGFSLVIYGIVFFSINKVILSHINGLGMMKSYAVFLFLRSALMLISLLLLINLKVDPNTLVVAIPMGESLLCIILLLYLFFNIEIDHKAYSKKWMIRHLNFGRKSVLGNSIMGLNLKVDILILGYFLDDALVGIYSLASMIFEGLLQTTVVLRSNINPIIATCYRTKTLQILERVLNRNKRAFYKMLVPLFLISIFCFPTILLISSVEDSFYKAWGVYGILTSGLTLVAGYMPFKLLLNQLDNPSLQTKYILLIFISNVSLNIILIPNLGLMGAAISTSVSYVLHMIYLRFFLARKYKINI